jgi:hypothetical protein
MLMTYEKKGSEVLVGSAEGQTEVAHVIALLFEISVLC